MSWNLKSELMCEGKCKPDFDHFLNLMVAQWIRTSICTIQERGFWCVRITIKRVAGDGLDEDNNNKDNDNWYTNVIALVFKEVIEKTDHLRTGMTHTTYLSNRKKNAKNLRCQQVEFQLTEDSMLSAKSINHVLHISWILPLNCEKRVLSISILSALS